MSETANAKRARQQLALSQESAMNQTLLPATTKSALEIAAEDAILGVPAAIVPATPAPRKLLSFTVVHGWLKGEHRCPFELHATGCRDLKKLLRTKQFSYEVLAETREEAMAIASAEHGFGAVWTQPCCLLKRMQAIGRA